MTKSEIFDDNAFISWAKYPEWTPTQAIFALQGKTPPNELSTDRLVEEFPLSRALLRCPEVYGAVWINHPANWVNFAHTCVESGAMSENWSAIFPESMPKSLESMFGKEPDYRQFIGAIGHGHMMKLGDLVNFAMCTGTKTQQPRYACHDHETATIAMGSRLGIAETNVVELKGCLVDVREFIDRYPETLFPLDERCKFWANWVRTHSGIVEWLAGHTNEKPLSEPEVQHATTGARWIFRKGPGNKWEVGHEGGSVPIKGGKGAEDFAVSVRSAGSDCLMTIMGVDTVTYLPTHGSDDMMDSKTAVQVQQQINDLKESLEIARNDGDIDLVDDYEQELATLTDYQKRSTQPGFKSKRLDAGDPLKSVTRRLRNRRRTLIKSIRNAGFDDIADHVEDHFKVADRSVIYHASDPAISWILDL